MEIYQIPTIRVFWYLKQFTTPTKKKKKKKKKKQPFHIYNPNKEIKSMTWIKIKNPFLNNEIDNF